MATRSYYEWGNGDNKFYTLETHDLEVKKITPDSKTAGGVRNGTYSPVTTAEIKFSTFLKKFNPISDLLGLKYKKKYPNIRFSLNTPGDTSLSPEDYRRSIDPLFDFFMEYSDRKISLTASELQGRTKSSQVFGTPLNLRSLSRCCRNNSKSACG